MFNDRQYIIADVREYKILDFSQFIEEPDTVLYNSGSTKFTIKYEGASPSYKFIYPIEGPYTIEQLKATQSLEEWPDLIDEP